MEWSLDLHVGRLFQPIDQQLGRPRQRQRETAPCRRGRAASLKNFASALRAEEERHAAAAADVLLQRLDGRLVQPLDVGQVDRRGTRPAA